MSLEEKPMHPPPQHPGLQALAARCGQKLKDKGWFCATAESCTGGLVAKLLTDTAGSSAWFDRAFITYTNLAKQQMLGVPSSLFAVDGAVSEPVVRAMAVGALNASAAGIAVSLSGVAGPDGGTPEKPVGTVWIGTAWQRADGNIAVVADCHHFEGDRQEIRYRAAEAALTQILKQASA